MGVKKCLPGIPEISTLPYHHGWEVTVAMTFDL